MIKPVNNHILIEPLKHDSFIPIDKGTYEEIGIVIEGNEQVLKGDKVYFDGWLAAKYPTGKDDEFFWLVNWNDVKAVEKND